MTFIFSWISLKSCEANVELGLNGCHTHGHPYSFSYYFSLCVSIDPAWEETWNTSSSSCTCTLLANPTVTQSSASQSGGHAPTLLHKHSTLLLPQRPSKLCSQLWRGHCQNWGSLHRVWGGESWHLWNGEDCKGAYEMRTVLPEMRFIVSEPFSIALDWQLWTCKLTLVFRSLCQQICLPNCIATVLWWMPSHNNILFYFLTFWIIFEQ